MVRFDDFVGHGMQAQQLNKDIFETIYYNALKASSELAAKEGPYETYSGCPVSKVYSFQTVLLCQFDEKLGFFYGFFFLLFWPSVGCLS